MGASTRRPRALVLGCGPAGAACALALASSDWDVETVRREGDAPGFGWLLMPNGVEALRALNALERAVEGVREIRRATIVDPRGERAEEAMARTYCGSRAALVDALVETRRAGDGGRETAGEATVSFRAEDGIVERVDIQTEDGTVVTRRFREDFDLVVGADGVRSMTYAALNGASSSRNVSGRCHTVITAGDSAELAEALRGRFVKRYFCTPARGSRPRRCCAIGLLGVSDARVLGFLQFDTHTHGEAPRVSSDGPKAMLDFFERALGVDRWLTDFGEDDETLSLIRRYLTQCADVEKYRPHVWRPVESGVAERLVGSNVALVGDAAHPMADFTSQGVSSALEDAVCLAKYVKNYNEETIAAQLQKYANERRGVVERYIAAGERLRNDFVKLPDGVSLARPFTRSGSVRLVNRRGVGISDLLLVGLVARRFQRNVARKRDANMLPSISLGGDEEKWERTFDDRWGVGWEHEHRGRWAEKERNDAINLPTLRQRAFNYRWATLPSEVIPLTAASTDFPAPKCVVEAIQSYAESGIFTYGPNEGIPEFRTAVAKYFTQRLRRGGADPAVAVGGAREVTSEVVMAANAAAAAIYAVTAALISPEDEVLVMDPVDFLLSTSVKAMGGKIVRYSVLNARASPSSIDDIIAQLEKLVTSKTKVLSICNPHNPLGIAWHARELMALAEFAEKHNLAILSDEVWCDLVHAPRTHVPTACVSACAAARTYTVLGFSKSHGLEGLRVGAVVAPSREALAACSSASATDVTANGCSTLSQVAAIAAMEHASDFDDGWLAEWRAHVRWCVSYAVYRLNSIPGVRATLPEACSIVFADISTILARLAPDAKDVEPERVFCDWLISSNSGVAVVPGLEQFFGPAARGRVRLAVATSPELLSKALDRFERACERFPTLP